jgi:hypothetical protein
MHRLTLDVAVELCKVSAVVATMTFGERTEEIAGAKSSTARTSVHKA